MIAALRSSEGCVTALSTSDMMQSSDTIYSTSDIRLSIVLFSMELRPEGTWSSTSHSSCCRSLLLSDWLALFSSHLQAEHRAGPRRHATAAARRATARVAPPSTTSPPPAPTASLRRALRWAPWSVAPSAAALSRPWTGPLRRPARWRSSSSSGRSSAERVTCCARSPPAARSARWSRRR